MDLKIGTTTTISTAVTTAKTTTATTIKNPPFLISFLVAPLPKRPRPRDWVRIPLRSFSRDESKGPNGDAKV